MVSLVFLLQGNLVYSDGEGLKTATLRLLIFLMVGAAIGGVTKIPRVEAQQEHLAVYYVFLKNQEQAGIAEEVKAATLGEQQSLEKKLREAFAGQRVQPATSSPLSREQESIALAAVMQPMQPAQVGRILSELQALSEQMRQQILARSAASRQAEQDAVDREVQALGGETLHRFESLNALVVRIPVEARPVLENLPLVQEVVVDQLYQAEMDVSAYAIGANTFWNAGFTGMGVDVAIIDSGIDHSHPALSSYNYAGRKCLSSAGNPSSDTTTDDINGHGTHVAGTVANNSPLYRGVAYGVNALLNGKAGFDLDGADGGGAAMYSLDAITCVDWALQGNAYRAEVVNLSYGGSPTTDDSSYERFFDAVIDQMGVVVTISAGNSGPRGGTISSPSIAYNVISVANMQDQNTVVRSDDSIRSTSSRGPTPGGRRKPDITAPGTGIISTNNNWESAEDYVSYSGTSMAAPHVAGAAALLMQRGVTDPMAIKAILINSAEDRGDVGWDATYGWGYMDLNHAFGHVDDTFLDAVQAHPSYRLYAGPVLSGDTASLVWHRRAIYRGAAYPNTYYTLTDLDMYGYNEANNSRVAESYSEVDNVEQLRFPADANLGVIKIKTYSTSIAGASSERFALATEEGFSSRTGPVLNLFPIGRGNLAGPIGSPVSVTLLVSNLGDLKAHDIRINMDYSAGLALQQGVAAPVIISALSAGETITAYTWVFTKTSASKQNVHFSATSNSYGEVFRAEVDYQFSIWIPLVGS